MESTDEAKSIESRDNHNHPNPTIGIGTDDSDKIKRPIDQKELDTEESIIGEELPLASSVTNNDNGDKREKRNWVLGNFEVFKEFENETDFNEWYAAGGGDWIIESNRTTKQNHLTECLCRFSHKYSSRRIPATPYDCHARLRIKRPLTALDEDQRILVEMTQTEHDHEPHEHQKSDGESIEEFRQRSISIESKKSTGGVSNKSKSNEPSLTDEGRPSSSMQEEITPEIEEYIREKHINDGLSANRIQRSMMVDRMKAPACDQIQRLIDSFDQSNSAGQDKCMELLDKKEKTDEKISQHANLVANLGRALDEEMQQTKEARKNSIEIGSGNSESEFDTGTTNKQGPSTRARRAKRVYSPPPPSTLIADSGRKRRREKNETEDLTPLTSQDNIHHSGSALKKWAKAPPSSLSSSLDSVKIKSNTPISQSVSTQRQCDVAPTDAQIIRQNEKLVQENIQLKQKNQEQQHQIQALIGANRELIWAFNESRREHDELMQQLRVMAKIVKDTGGNQHGTQLNQQNKNTNKGGRMRRAGGPNSKGETTGGARPRKKQRPGMMYMAENALPPSLCILKKQGIVHSQTSESLVESNGHDQPMSSKEVTHYPPSTQTEQLMLNITREIEDRRALPDSPVGNRKDEMIRLRQQLEHMPSEPDINKFIGTRKPAFYTPKDFGDWRSTMSSVFRKQMVLRLFEALCPEFIRTNIVELARLNPQRADFIQRSLNFAYDTENELFIGLNGKEEYLMGIAEKILTLQEAAISRQQKKSKYGGGEGETVDGDARKAAQQQQKRTLADVLKPKRIKAESGAD